MEQEGELSHTWYRKYESQSGRWTSPDPYGESMSVGEPQSFNRYSYVQNDPVNFVDPSGLQEDQCVDSHGNPVKCPDDDIHYWDDNNFTIDRTQTSLFVFSWSGIDTFLRDWRFVLNSRFSNYQGSKSGTIPPFSLNIPYVREIMNDTQERARQREATDAIKRQEYFDCVKRAVDNYHNRSNEEDAGNAAFVLGYNPSTGDAKGAASTVIGAFVNKYRGGSFKVGLGTATTIKFGVTQVHGFFSEMSSWEKFKQEGRQCVESTRMP